MFNRVVKNLLRAFNVIYSIDFLFIKFKGTQINVPPLIFFLHCEIIQLYVISLCLLFRREEKEDGDTFAGFLFLRLILYTCLK